MSTKKDLPIGIQSFKKIITENYIYIDKTKDIYDLTRKGLYYFLSRPRRFGKTLLCTTLEALFKGNRELFKSLYIDSTDFAWKEHPVIFCSFATMAVNSAEALRKILNEELDAMAQKYKVTLIRQTSLGGKLKSLILELAKKDQVVLLIDEYDVPILKNIDNFEEAENCREVLAEFFSALKDGAVDEYMRYVFITGISKFSKTSIFSGLNNLQDLTTDSRAATLLGYTAEEIEHNYESYLTTISQKTGQSLEELLHNIRIWYNGYQFANPSEAPNSKVYNPYSVMLYLDKGTLDNYWFDTGTPTFLMKLIKKQNYAVSTIEGSLINKDEMKSYDIEQIDLIQLLYQSGYLTIASYDPHTENYTMKFPNKEVKNSFFQFVVLRMTKAKKSALKSLLYTLTQALTKPDLDTFFKALQVFFAKFPYHLHTNTEKHYQGVFFSVLSLIGADITVEEPTNNGRIDAVIETNTHIMIIEFKLNGTAESALKQISQKNYYQKYLLSNKEIVLIGVQFDMQERNIAQWIVEKPSQ